MSSEGSITRRFHELEGGDGQAAQALWQRYFDRLVHLARGKLQGASRGAADEEDVALSAFASFCRCAQQGRLTDLDDRDSLWRVLVRITAHKVADQVRYDRAAKRPGAAGPPAAADLEQLIGREPTPAFAAQLAEERQRLLTKLTDPDLGDPHLLRVAQLRMDGYLVEEVAALVGCSVPTVKRRLRVIRSLWAAEIGP